MRIEIVSDTICPWCFIGKRRLEEALSTRPRREVVEIIWRPFQLNPDMPAEGMERHAYLEAKFGGAARARRQYGVIDQTGRDQGIHFRFDLIQRTPNTVDSHRLIHFSSLHGRQDAVVEALFRAYFTQGRDIGDVAELDAIAAQAGLDRDAVTRYLRSGEDAEQIVQEGERIRRLGVNSVPCFVVEGEYAVSGAQSVEVFQQIFDLVREQDADTPAAAE